MKRLTTDKPVSEMNMVELAHNCCYTQDGVVRYRDFETDIDVIELARHLMLSYGLLEENDTATHDDDALNDELFENLAYGPKEIEGLIALFYRNVLAMTDLRECLKEYESAEEQELLAKLPCKIGDELYWISDEDSNGRCGLTVRKHRNAIQRICIAKEGVFVTTDETEEYYDKLGTRYAYLTREEAEEALREMEKGGAS